MKALVVDNGAVELAADRPVPQPSEDEALIAVRMAGICSTDLEIIKGYMGFAGVMGHEFVGVVEKGPARWQGKRVVGEINCPCGRCDLCQAGLSNHCRNRQVIGIDQRDGAFAEYLTLPCRNLYEVPEHVTDEQAVFVEPLAAACQVVRQVPLDAHQKALVLGDGRLGLLVAQVMHQQAPGRVTLLGKHSEKVLFADKRGIQTLLLADCPRRSEWDIVVDCTSSADGFALACALVRPRGTLVLKSTFHAEAPVDLAPLVINEVTLVGSRCGPFAEAIEALATDQVVTNGLITARFPLDRGVDAFEAAAQPGQLKVILTI